MITPAPAEEASARARTKLPAVAVMAWPLALAISGSPAVNRSAGHQLGDAEDGDLALDSLRVGLILDHAIGDGASAREVDLSGRVDGHEVELRIHSSTAREVRRRRKPYCA